MEESPLMRAFNLAAGSWESQGAARMKKLYIFLSVFAVSWPAAGWGQDHAWAFPELLTKSLAAHPNVLARRSSAAAAESDHEGALWQRYPTPAVQAISGGHNTPGNISRFQVQQPLWTGGRITAGIEATQFRKDAADHVVSETRQDLALRVAAAYVEAVRQQAREEQGRRGVEEHKRLLGLIGRRVQQEISAPVDRELAQSRLYQANNDLSFNVQQRTSALAQLTQLVGQPVARVAALQADLLTIPQAEDIALQKAIAASPTLARIAAEQRAAGADVDSRRSALMPQVGVRFERDFGGLSDSRLMLVLEAQPGAGLSAATNVEAARSRQRALEHDREGALRDLQERVSIDWNELRHARERRENAELAQKTAARVFESFTQQFTTGRKTWIDVLNAAREYTQAEFAVADAAAQYAGAALRLGIVTGATLPPTP